MRVGAVADLHGFLPPVPEVDVLLVAGDVCPTADHGHEFQARWLDTDFRRWLEAVPAGVVVGVAGNHDFVFDRAPELVPDDLPWTYLQDTAATVNGLTVWGSPWTPWFGGWAFNAPRGDPGEPFLAERYAGVPGDVDVLMFHGPPRGFGDLTAGGREVGAQAAVDLLERTKPALAVFGHVHEGRGRWTHGPTTLLNCAAVTLEYALVDDPVMVVDL